MGQRTIAVAFYNYVDEDGRGHTAVQGETVELSDAEEERGEALGAFEDSEYSPHVDSLNAAFGTSGVDPESGVDHLHAPPEVHEDAKTPPEIEGVDDEHDQPDPLGEAFPELAEGVEAPKPGEPTQGPPEPKHTLGQPKVEAPKSKPKATAKDDDKS